MTEKKHPFLFIPGRHVIQRGNNRNGASLRTLASLEN